MYSFDEDKLTIDGKTFKLSEIDDDTILLEPEPKELRNITFTVNDYPEKLIVEIHHETGFETYLFHEVHLSKGAKGIKVNFYCLEPNKYWEGTWGLSTFLTALNGIVMDSAIASVEGLELDDDWKKIEISFSVEKDFKFQNKIEELAKVVSNYIKQAERVLLGVNWRKEYESDESLFCTEMLYPLLRKMSFIDVRYTHGQKEYGKDFTFSEQTKFGNMRHFGLQAKAGNIRGNVNSDIDEIIGQLNDAFSMPYHEISANESRQISTFIVAISGQFTDNAKDKIIQKIPNYFKGSVYFLDRDKINELIERFWK